MVPGTGRARLGKLGVGAAIGIVAVVLALALGQTPFLNDVELMTYDWRMRLTARPEAPSDDVVLVSIDDDSVRRMAAVGAGRWPWPRLIHASLIDYLARGQAKVIVYDILFTEPDVQRFTIGDDEWTGQASDAALAESVAKAGNVILAADAAGDELRDTTRTLRPSSEGRPARSYQVGTDCVEERPIIVPPILPLDRAALAIGHTRMVRDGDGPLRRHMPFVRSGGQLVPSLAMAAALTATGGALPAVPRRACPPLIPYRGPGVNADGFPTFLEFSFYDLFYSAEQILAGEPPEVAPALFKDKIVVVAATAAETYEVEASPFEQGVAGGEVHANLIDSLLRGRTIESAGTAPSLAATTLPALVVGASGALVGVWTLGGAAAAVGVGLVWLAIGLFGRGTWLPMVQPLLALGLAFGGQLAWQYFVEGREKRQVKRLFSRYVPRDVYEQLMDDPERAALGGKRRTMTVLFSDVRGFTTMSEKSTPEEVVSQLNEYFSSMVDVLFQYRGTLDKFVGDMVMGLFGAPVDDPDHAEHAVQAALAMTRALDELNKGWAAANRPVLDIGIGISTGEMVAGNIGSNTIMSYTVIGDTVNLGARLESLNKEYGTRIIISDATRAALRGQYTLRPLGDVVVKGKSRPVAIFEVKPA